MIKTKFKHTLDTQQIVIKTEKNEDDRGYLPKVAGSFIPLIRFYDETIEFNQIESFELKFGSSLLPTVSIVLNDVTEKYKYVYPIKVGSIFTFFVGVANDKQHTPIKGDFYMTSPSSGSGSYQISGQLHVPDLYTPRNRVFENMTSIEIFEEIAKECRLGFSSNIDVSTDEMNWIQYQNNFDFLNYLTDKARVNDDTFIRVFIDQYWNLNVIDIRKAIETKPFDTFKTLPVTGADLGEDDVIIQGTNLEQEIDKPIKFFIYDSFSMFDDFSNIAMTEPKKLNVIDYNTSKLEESRLQMFSPHEQHILQESTYTNFSNDNAYDGYFSTKIRNSYNELMIKGQKFLVTVPYFVQGLYMYMSYNQDIYNPQLFVGGESQDPNTTFDQDTVNTEPPIDSRKITKNEVLSGEVLITGMSISYSSTMVSHTSRMEMHLSLFLKPKDKNTKETSRIVVPNYTKQPYQRSQKQMKIEASQNPSSNGYNIEKAVSKLMERVRPGSLGECAKYVRIAIEAGGLSTNGRPISAKNYDTFLPKLGFEEVPMDSIYKGDIVVIQSVGGHPHGHIAMWTGSQWVSDFKQNDLFPASAYRRNPPRVNLYRWTK